MNQYNEIPAIGDFRQKNNSGGRMAKRRPKKPMLKFPKRMQKKMIVMFTVVAALMIGLIGRLMYIEYTSGEKYEKIVLAQQGADAGLERSGASATATGARTSQDQWKESLCRLQEFLPLHLLYWQWY